MRNLAIFICIAVIAWLFITRKPVSPAAIIVQSPTPAATATPVKILTPAEEAAAFLDRRSVTTDDLVDFCATHPHAQQLLYAKKFRLDCTVKRVAIFGLNSERAEVTMMASSGRSVVCETQISQHDFDRNGSKFASDDGDLRIVNSWGKNDSLAAVGVSGVITVYFKSTNSAAIRLQF